MNNFLVVSQGEDTSLYSSGLYAKEFNWIPEPPKEKTFKCFAKFRYRQPDQKVLVEIIDKSHIKVDFEEKQRAITPGQFVVLYDEKERCLGGGIIEKFYY
jgi:tRNA-specific 2-thiouridylase